MNTNDFTYKKSTVVSVSGTNEGTEVWVRYDNDIESSYLVKDDSFRIREGHQLTAILYGRHAVALRNDSTMLKIQLLAGGDLVGPGPAAKSRSAVFWFLWALILVCPGFIFAGIPAEILGSFHNVFLTYLGNTLSIACYLAYVFGIPFWYLLRPALLRRKHRKHVQEADRAIAALFNPL
ncbi:MAG: hypothetical protein ABSH48_16835 [Verrucomicrobiota bacterium]|jgi:hypothetical protein